MTMFVVKYIHIQIKCPGYGSINRLLSYALLTLPFDLLKAWARIQRVCI